MSAGRPSGRAQVARIAAREVRERTRARSFRVSTTVAAALAAAVVVLPAQLSDDEEPAWTVAVTSPVPPGLADAVDAAALAGPGRVSLRELEPGVDATSLLEEGRVDAVLVDGEELVVDGDDAELEAIMAAAAARAGVADRLRELGVQPELIDETLASPPLRIRSLDAAEGDEASAADQSTREATAFFGIVGLFIAIATYGSWVLTGVLEEKANRIVEVVLSAVTPRQLLTGKVLGTGLAGLLQLNVVALVGLGAATASGSLPDLDLGATAASLLLWFLLGFTFYAVGYAAAGSLVSRQEDAQGAVTPMVLIVTVAYLASLILVVPEPTSTVARAVSLLPPVAPLAMPARVAVGAVEPWEMAVAVALMAVAIWLMITLAARLYTNAILRTGARVPLREALGGGTSDRASRRPDARAPAPTGSGPTTGP